MLIPPNPCTECGGRNLEILTYRHDHYVKCRECGNSGPKVRGPLNSIYYWNHMRTKGEMMICVDSRPCKYKAIRLGKAYCNVLDAEPYEYDGDCNFCKAKDDRKSQQAAPAWADPGTQYYEFSNPTKINSKRKKGGLSLI